MKTSAKLKLLILSGLLGLSGGVYAQQSVGIGTSTPNNKSVLDLVSTTQGFLMPRMSSIQRTAMALTAAENGMLVYDTSLNTIYQWNGAAWTALGGADNLGNHTATTNLEMAGFKINSTNSHVFSITGLDVMSISSATYAISALQGQFRALSSTAVTTPAYSFATSTTTGMSNPVANQLTLVTTGVERVRIGATGNVGIGTTSPGVKLDVRGTNAKATTAVYQNIVGIGSTDAAQPLVIQLGVKTDATATNRYGGIEVDDAGVKRNLSLQPTGGFVGIGNTAPTAQLHTTGGVRHESLGTGVTRYVTVDGTGNLGTGTTVGALLSGSGSTNTIPYWTSPSSLGTSIMQGDATSIAIGTSLSPNYIFQVAQSSAFPSIYAVNAGNGGAGVWGYSNNATSGEGVRGVSVGAGNGVVGANSGTGSGGYFTNSSSGYGLYVDNTGGGYSATFMGGNVGIGTNTPFSSKLQVYGSNDPLIMLDGPPGSQIPLTFSIAGSFKWAWYMPSGTENFNLWHYGAPSQNYISFNGTTGDINIVPTSGNVAIGGGGIIVPTARLHVEGSFRLVNGSEAAGRLLTSDASGNATWQSLASQGIPSGTGTTNYLPKWSGANTLSATSLVYDNGTQLGIGTTTPSANARTHIFTNLSTTAPIAVIENGNGTGHGSLRLSGGSTHYTIGSDYSDNSFKISNSATSIGSTTRLTINSGGQVGIGTTSPSAMLHVSVGTNATARIQSTATGLANLEIYGMVNKASVDLYDNGTWTAGMGYDINSDYLYWYDAAATTYSLVGKTGRIGIGGVTTPQNKLDVEGAVAIGASYSGTSTAPANGLIVEGRLGVGTNAPNYNLHVVGANPSIVVEETGASNANLIFARAGVQKWYLLQNFSTPTDNIAFYDPSIGQKVFQINQGGNIGIGTTSPMNRLDIEGGLAVGATYSGTNTAPANGMIVEGTVGFGTGAPSTSYQLHVEKNSTGTLAYFDNNSTTSGTALNANVTTTATGTGTRTGVYSVAWYGQSVNRGVYAYGFGGTDSYGVFATSGGASGSNWAVYSSGSSFASGGTWQTSDERFKNNIAPLNNALSIINKLEVKTYEYNKEHIGKGLMLPAGKQYGFMAQEVEKVVPEAVMDTKLILTPTPQEAKDENYEEKRVDAKVLNPTTLLPISIKAIQEQQKQIEDLQAENLILKAQNDLLRADIEQIKIKLGIK